MINTSMLFPFSLRQWTKQSSISFFPSGKHPFFEVCKVGLLCTYELLVKQKSLPGEGLFNFGNKKDPWSRISSLGNTELGQPCPYSTSSAKKGLRGEPGRYHDRNHIFFLKLSGLLAVQRQTGRMVRHSTAW